MTVKRVEVLAYAKINLMLDIIRRRTDGYHDLFMIMQSVGVADRVTVEREPGRKLRLTASIDDIPLDDKNIAWKAAALFFKTTGLRRPGLHIHLEKHIPHAAGLAGGSADGASQQVIGGHIVILAQGQQVAQRQGIGATLIAGVHGLGGAQHLCQFGLTFMRLCTQLA